MPPSRPPALWVFVLAGPALFLGLIVAASAYLTVQGLPADQIAKTLPNYAPHILTSVLALLGLLAAFTLDLRQIWAQPSDADPIRDIMAGSVIGAVIGLAYFSGLSSTLDFLQREIGDYVSPGAVTPAVTSNLVLFFAANVVLAPLVEETLYRGHILGTLRRRRGAVSAVILSSLSFGFLHWTGGLWYMVATAVLVGVPFATLSVMRRSILAAFSAHFTLNLLEFLIAALL